MEILIKVYINKRGIGCFCLNLLILNLVIKRGNFKKKGNLKKRGKPKKKGKLKEKGECLT